MDQFDKGGISAPTGTILDGLINIPFVGPIIGAGIEAAAYTLDGFVRMRDELWAARIVDDPGTPIYDQLCREIGPPR
jgi:hypothetical protein